MSLTLRRPFAVAATIKQIAKPQAASNAARSFHSSPLRSQFQQKFAPHHQPTNSSPLKVSRDVIRATFRRSYMQNAPDVAQGGMGGSLTRRLLVGAGLFGGTLLAINMVFNRETRTDGGMPAFEREYLHDIFAHTGLGLGIVGTAAWALHTRGWSVRLMSANPWLVAGGGLVAMIGSMMATRMTPPENYLPKYACWTVFNVSQAAMLSPLMFLQPALLFRAGLLTLGVVGSISFVGATAKQDKYLYLGGPLLAGVAVVALSGFAPLVLPATAARTLMFTENIWLYGGLAVFGGFTLYDVQKFLYHARLAEQGLMKKDAVNESISLQLDFINMFIRIVQIMGMNQRKR